MKIELTYGGPTTTLHNRWVRVGYYISLLLLAMLFLWKATIGIAYFEELQMSFHKQQLFKGRESFSAKTSIILQLLAGSLLLTGLFTRKTRSYGLGLTTAILTGYTVYAQLALSNAFGFSICTCIGWFDGMSWKSILSINALLLFVSVFSLLLTLKARRPP